jgi:LacI family transcriptional regulator
MTGLGITTISRALKNGPEISAETRARVRAIATELGYRPDRAGVRLRTGRTNVIGLILDQAASAGEFGRRILLGVSRVLHDTPYHLVVKPRHSLEDPMDPVRYFVESRAADALLFTHTTPDDARVSYLLERDFPFVTHGQTNLPLAHPFYDFDTYRFAYEAVLRLAANGRRRLALIAPASMLTCSGHAMAGFRQAASETGAELVCITDVDDHESLTSFRVAGLALARSEVPPDGIVCASELGSVALIAGVRDGGLTVGRDVDIIAKATSELLDHLDPAIDSFYEDLTFAGEELGRLMLRRLSGARAEDLQTLAQPVLQVRRTTG